MESEPILSSKEDVFDAPRLRAAHSTILDLPPSCIEFVPFCPELFVVGTYCLDSEETQNIEKISPVEEDQAPNTQHRSQSRSGSLLLYRLERKGLYCFQVGE